MGRRIFYRCPDHDVPYGGVKTIYEHVDILNKHGIDALVLHDSPEFRCTWFDNATRTSSVVGVSLTKADIIVFPEVHAKYSLEAPEDLEDKKSLLKRLKDAFRKRICGPDNPDQETQRKIFRHLFDTASKKVIFNQGCYLTFSGHSLTDGEKQTVYTDDSVIATIVVSEDSERYIRYAFPKMSVHRVHNAINSQLFYYGEKKKRQICFMLRKSYSDLVQVITILKNRGMATDFELVPLENMPQQQVAKVMRDSMIFLSFGSQEGFSLPPAEAMACGCIVIGYDGRGGSEYFYPEFSYPIAAGDIIAFVKTIEKVIAEYHSDPESLVNRGLTASNYICTTYNTARQADDVLRVWKQIIFSGNVNRQE